MRFLAKLICFVAVLVGIAMWLFLPETLALAAHLRRPKATQVGTYEARVPLSWLPIRDEGTTTLVATKSPGRFRSRVLGKKSWAIIDFSTATELQTGRDLQRNVTAVDERLRITTWTVDRTIAGQPSVCFTTQSAVTPNVREIRCVPADEKHGISASFIGSPEMIDEFYAILDTVTKHS